MSEDFYDDPRKVTVNIDSATGEPDTKLITGGRQKGKMPTEEQMDNWGDTLEKRRQKEQKVIGGYRERGLKYGKDLAGTISEKETRELLDEMVDLSIGDIVKSPTDDLRDVMRKKVIGDVDTHYFDQSETGKEYLKSFEHKIQAAGFSDTGDVLEKKRKELNNLMRKVSGARSYILSGEQDVPLDPAAQKEKNKSSGKINKRKYRAGYNEGFKDGWNTVDINTLDPNIWYIQSSAR